MRKLAIAFAVLAVIAGIVCYNIWRAYQDPVTTPPTLVELGRQQLHQQLVDSEKREAEIEQADWGSITLLQDLIKAHQTRIDKLNGNSQAGEIIAHDKDAIARLQKRIADLEEQQRAQPPASDSGQSEGEAPAHATAEPAAKSPVAPKSAQPARKPATSQSPQPSGATPHQPAHRPVSKTAPQSH